MGIIGRIVGHFKHRLSPVTIAKEVGGALDRAAGQGSAEVTQALFTGNAYVPYGPTQEPFKLEKDPGNVHGTGKLQSMESKGVSDNKQAAPIYRKEDYDASLDRDAARLASKGKGEEQER